MRKNVGTPKVDSGKKRERIDIEKINKNPAKADEKSLGKPGNKAARTLFNIKKNPRRKLR